MTVLTQIDPVVAARANSIRDQFREHLALLRGIPNLPANEELSEDLQAKISSYAERRSALIEQFGKMVNPVLAMIEQLGTPGEENPPFGDVFAEVAVVRANRMVFFEEAALIAGEGHDLANLAAVELKPIVEQLDEDFKTTHAAVKEDLDRIGQGIESTVAGRRGHNGSAAELQFDTLSRQNVRSVKAFVMAHDERNRCNSLTETGHRCQRSREAIRRELSRLAAAEIKI